MKDQDLNNLPENDTRMSHGAIVATFIVLGVCAVIGGIFAIVLFRWWLG